MIDKSSVESLKNIIDIVDIISSYLEIKKAGVNFKANCPFHGEKTASFIISPVKQIYHCFGCGVGGDAINFVMEKDKLNYVESLEKIALLLNFTLSYSNSNNNFSKKTSNILERLNDWYIENLKINSNIIKYLLDRGVSKESIKEFNIGYSETSYQTINFLNKNSFALDIAEEGGIVAKNTRNEYYARLIDRIIFPIYNSNGSITGFGGRTVKNHSAKYINSPQTKLFNKSQILYGYSLARKYIFLNKIIIICEGYLDVIMLHQAGFKEAVASLGTSLTKEHFPILRRGEPKIILAYDGDKAGINAGIKASIMLSENGFNGEIIIFPEGKDPADLVFKNEIENLKNILENGTPFIEFSIRNICKEYNLNIATEKEKAFILIKNYLNSLTPIIKEEAIKLASSILDINSTFFQSYNKMEEINKSNMFKNQNDIIELSIIKTIIESKDKINKDILNYIESKIFNINSINLLNNALSGNKDNPLIMSILINTDIKVMNMLEFKNAIINLLIKFYKKELKNIGTNIDIPLSQKISKIKDIKLNIIPKLERREL